MIIGFLLALLFSKQFPLRRYLLILVLTPMEPVLRRRRCLLPLLLRADLRPAQPVRPRVHGRALHPRLLDGRRHGRHRLRGCLDVVAVRHVARAGRPCRACRSISTRRRQSIAFPSGAASGRSPFPIFAACPRLRAAVPHHRGIQALRRRLPSTDGGLGTETIAIYVYRVAFQYVRTSELTALAYILLFTVIVLTNLYLYLSNRRAEEA